MITIMMMMIMIIIIIIIIIKMVMIKIIMMLLQNQLKTLKLLNYLFSFLSRKSLLKKKKNVSYLNQNSETNYLIKFKMTNFSNCIDRVGYQKNNKKQKTIQKN